MEAAYNKLSEAISKSLRSAALALKIARTCFITLFAAIAGAAQFTEFWPGTPTWSQQVGIAATIFVALGGLYASIADNNAPQQLEEARQALDRARDLEIKSQARGSEYLVIEEDLRRASSLYLSMHSMRGALERIAHEGKDLEVSIPNALFQAAETHLPRALGFRMEDQWTVGIYRAELTASGRHQLVLADQLRAIKCEPEKARKWPEGVGFTGIAFTNRKEIIVDDASHPTVANVFSLPKDMARPHDAAAYVSYAIVPILLGNENIPWGVAIATSNVPGHFNLDVQPGVHAAEAVRGLAGMVALGISVVRDADGNTKAA